MITGSAPTGSSTPPICAAAEMWQFAPDLRAASHQRVRIDHGAVADLAPALMYIGGMQVTPLPM